MNGTKTAIKTSGVAVIIVTAINARTPILSDQSEDMVGLESDPSYAFSLTASVADGGTLSYQWYSNTTKSDKGGTELGDETDEILHVSTQPIGVYYYYLVITNTNNDVDGEKTASVTSRIFTLTVASDGLGFNNIEGGLEVKKGTANTSGKVVVPPTHDGKPVIKIADSAFANCSELTSIFLPDGLLVIGDQSFWFCTKLTAVIIPETVTAITANSFAHCDSLQGIYIPENVDYIADDAFMDCSELESITVAEGNKVYKGENNCLINISEKTLVKGCNTSIIPEGVEHIGKYAFRMSKIISVTLPESVKTIGIHAFYGCQALTSISLSENLTTIGNRAFYYCQTLESITFPQSLKSIGSGSFDFTNKLSTIYYNGTMEQWGEIQLVIHEPPYSIVKGKKIVCTDGEFIFGA